MFSLDGDTAYVGDGNHVLRFPLPEGAQDLSVNEGELGDRFIQIDNGFVDRLALPPGQNTRQILYPLRAALRWDQPRPGAFAALPGRRCQCA